MAHGSTLEKAKRGTEKMTARMADKMGVNVSWDDNVCRLSAPVLKSGTIVVDDQDISVEINLGMMGKPMKGMIEKMIRQGFAKSLGNGD